MYHLIELCESNGQLRDWLEAQEKEDSFEQMAYDSWEVITDHVGILKLMAGITEHGFRCTVELDDIDGQECWVISVRYA